MRSRVTTSRLVLVAVALAASVALASTPAHAAPAPGAPAIARAYTAWVSTLHAADCDGTEVAALYTKRAILLATFKEYVQGRPAITEYFDELSCKDSLAVSTQRLTSARDGALGYATGLYTFTYRSSDGTTVTVPARFTFVFENRDGRWLIATHHSSQNPESRG
ncbi:MAG: SgcJ/EcaC family oxidoreductase [Actinobacteria bacterium]|jgi:uncharacterized protein (TIGR02246 family)|nr:SgcJ/EcaC family oxidoreductase [Actinomycetota bacterium]